MSFKDNLKNEIAYHDLLLKELADKAGIPKRTLDSYVDSRGTVPPADVAVRLAQVLGTSVEYLVTGEAFYEKPRVQERLTKIINQLTYLSKDSLDLVEVIVNAIAEKENKL